MINKGLVSVLRPVLVRGLVVEIEGHLPAGYTSKQLGIKVASFG